MGLRLPLHVGASFLENHFLKKLSKRKLNIFFIEILESMSFLVVMRAKLSSLIRFNGKMREKFLDES